MDSAEQITPEAVLSKIERTVSKRWARLSRHDQEDLVGIVAEKYYRAWDSDGSPSGLQRWLVTTIDRAAVDVHRAAQVRPKAAELEPEGKDGQRRERPDDPLTLVIDAYRQSPSLMGAWEDMRQRLFAGLRSDEVQLFTRKCLHQERSKDIADDLGISTAAVDKRISRLKVVLRGRIARQPEIIEPVPRLHQHRPQVR